jgi:putative ABC transport system ATP-binding protein
MPLLQLHHIRKEYVSGAVKTVVLKDINLSFDAGEFVAIMGASGSGKSTLMNILGFLDRPTQGQYFFEENDVTHLNENQLADVRNQKVGFIFQSFNLLPRTSALDNVRLPLIYSDVPAHQQKALATELLVQVGLEDRLGNKPNQLSGGQQQRVAIARALVNKPKVVFADEPTGNLDSKSSLEIMQILTKLNKEKGNTIIMVTHEPDIAQYAKRILTMHDGEIIRDYLNPNPTAV